MHGVDFRVGVAGVVVCVDDVVVDVVIVDVCVCVGVDDVVFVVVHVYNCNM